MKINYIAVLVTTVVSFVLNFIWFHKLFSVQMGTKDKGFKFCPIGMSLFLVPALVTSLVMAALIEAARIIAMFGYVPAPLIPYLLVLAIWIGFYLPQSLSKKTLEGRKWNYVAIISGFDLVRLLVIAIIFWYWR